MTAFVFEFFDTSGSTTAPLLVRFAVALRLLFVLSGCICCFAATFAALPLPAPEPSEFHKRIQRARLCILSGSHCLKSHQHSTRRYQEREREREKKKGKRHQESKEKAKFSAERENKKAQHIGSLRWTAPRQTFPREPLLVFCFCFVAALLLLFCCTAAVLLLLCSCFAGAWLLLCSFFVGDLPGHNTLLCMLRLVRVMLPGTGAFLHQEASGAKKKVATIRSSSIHSDYRNNKNDHRKKKKHSR